MDMQLTTRSLLSASAYAVPGAALSAPCAAVSGCAVLNVNSNTT